MTELNQENGISESYESFVLTIGMPASLGIRSAMYAALSDDIHGGEYIVPDEFMTFRGFPKIGKTSKQSDDKELQDKLWKMSEELTGYSFVF